jgi:hypothetical protein
MEEKSIARTKEHKRDIEKEILMMLSSFEEEYGVSVNSVDLEQVHSLEYPNGKVVLVTLGVIL